jgi:hypothetical protein
MLQAQCIAGAHDIEKFDGRDLPLRKIDTPFALNDLQSRIEQDRARQDGKLGEVTGERRVISRDLDGAVHGQGVLAFHGDSFVCK